MDVRAAKTSRTAALATRTDLGTNAVKDISGAVTIDLFRAYFAQVPADLLALFGKMTCLGLSHLLFFNDLSARQAFANGIFVVTVEINVVQSLGGLFPDQRVDGVLRERRRGGRTITA